MKKIFFIILAWGLLLAPPYLYGADIVKLRHIASAYADSKGGGIKSPEGVACNEKSAFIIADSGNGRLLHYTFEGEALRGGEEIKVPELSYPVRVQIDSKGSIFVLDGKHRRIVRLGADRTFKGYVSPAGLPSQATIAPKSFKIDSSDNMYILDVFSGYVLVLDRDGKYSRQIAFPENYDFFSDLAVDSKGTVYLLESTNAMVFSAAKDSKTFSPVTKGLKEYMNFPCNIAVDSRGIIYLADQHGGSIILLGQDGAFKGQQLSFGWKEGLVRYPSQICLNDKGYLFIADRNNNRVQVFTFIK